MDENKVNLTLDINTKFVLKALSSDDVIIKNLKIGKKNACLIFISDVVDKAQISEFILKPLKEVKTTPKTETALSLCFLSPESKKIKNLKDCVNEIVMGNTILFCDGFTTAFSFSLRKFEKRAISEPPTSTVIKGPREGFVESLPVNVSLMRRKLKSKDLRFIYTMVGKYSSTSVAICYVNGIANPKLIQKLLDKLKNIDIDAVLDSSYVSKLLGEHKRSIFKQVGNTEKPDILAAKILEGRVAVFVDGSPIALTVPYLLIEDFQSPSDYYSSSYSATVYRVIRIFSVLLSLFLPSFYLASELFHLQFIPLSFLLTIENSIKGIPLSPSYEIFFTLLIFEILNEASVRMPKYVGMVVSIVGGLVLGETAVNAGIISAPTLMIIAFSGICLYTAPELVQTFSLIRFLLLVVAGSLGSFGLICTVTFIIIYLVSFESYETPLCAPFSPLITKDLKDSVYKNFLIEQKMRPLSLKNHNRVRIRDTEGDK